MRKCTAIISLISLFCFFNIAYGIAKQVPEEKIDSLRDILPNRQGTFKVDIYNQLSWEYRNSIPDSSIYFGTKANVLSKSINYSQGEIQSLNFLGVAERNKSHYSDAFEYFLKALQASEDAQNIEQKGYALINIGNIYIYQTNFVGAIQYFEKAIEPAVLLNNESMEAYCYLNLGRTYSRIEQYDKAEEYFLKTRKIRRQLGDIEGLIASAVDLGELYRLQGDLDKALEYFFLSLDDIKKVENQGALAFTLNDISKIYRQKGNLDLALKYGLKALKIAKEFGLKNDERKTLENLSLIYQQQGDHELALKTFKEHIYKKDSIFNEKSTRKIEGLKSRYEAEKKAVIAKHLEETAALDAILIRRLTIIIVLSIFGGVTFLALTILYYRTAQNRKRLNEQIGKQKEQVEKDKVLIEQQAAKLKALDLAKSRFFSNISHDLRSPLSLILGNYEQIKKDKDNYFTSKTEAYLEVADKNAKRLLYLTDEINELTKLEEGKLKLNPVHVNISPYLNMLVSIFKSTAEYKSISIQFESELDDNATLLLDPIHFEKIIYNLVSNALKHSKPGGKMTVKVLKFKDEKVGIRIEDNGEGIPDASLPYIFDRYYQSPQNKFHVYEGLGIGLSLVKELVELHQGEITVESKVNVGTTFVLSFPDKEKQMDGVLPEKSDYIVNKSSLWSDLWEKTYQKEKSIKVDSISNIHSLNTTILIVEDHPEVRDYIKVLVQDTHKVLEAENGLKALEILEKQPVNLVITDLMMPWMDGFELLEAMRQNENYSSIPVLVVSARNTENDKFKVLSQGINDILQKPFNQQELLMRVRNLLEQKKHWSNKNEASLIINNPNLIDDIEKELLEKIEHLVLEKVRDANLSVLELADAMAASERKVYRMIKKLTKLTPLEYIKEIKWQYLEKLIKEKSIKNATEAAHAIGLKNVSNFKKQFHKRFHREVDEMIAKLD